MLGQKSVAQAFTVDQKAALLAEAKARRSKVIYPALMLALHAGMRDAEVRGLQWGRVDLERAMVTVGASKTEAGEGRTIPLNADVLAALVQHSNWYLEKFHETRPSGICSPSASRSRLIQQSQRLLSKQFGRRSKRRGDHRPLARQPAHVHYGPG